MEYFFDVIRRQWPELKFFPNALSSSIIDSLKRTWIFWFVTGILIFGYFEIIIHYWFLGLVNGYMIKVWIMPLVAALLVFFYQSQPVSLIKDLKEQKLFVIPLALYVIFGTLSLALNESLYLIVKYGLIMFGPLMTVAVIFHLFRSNKQITMALVAFSVIAISLSMHAVYFFDVFDFRPLISKPYPVKYMWTNQIGTMMAHLAYVGDLTGVGFFRNSKTVPFVDEPAFSAMLIPLIYFGFYVACNNLTKLGRYFYVMPMFLLWSMLNTGSRASFVAFSAGLILFLYFIRHKRRDILIICTLTVLLTSTNLYLLYRLLQTFAQLLHYIGTDVAVQYLGSEDISAKLLSLVGEIKSYGVPTYYDGHVLSLAETIRLSKNSLITGVGFSNMLNGFSKPDWNMGIEHNRYLFILASTGVVTLLGYLGFILVLIFKSIQITAKRLQKDQRELGVIFAPAVIAFAVQINNCGQERYYYWIFFGFALAWLRNCEAERSGAKPTR